MVLQPVLRDEVAVRRREPAHAADQTLRDVHRAALDIRQMVLEANNAGRFVQRIRIARMLREQVRAHAGVVLVVEAQVRSCESGTHAMALDDLLEQGLRPRVCETDGEFVAESVAQHSAGAHDRRSLRLAAGQKLVERRRLAAFEPLDQPEVGARQQAEVVGVLSIDALEALGDHEPDAGRQFRERRVLT